MRLFSYVVRYDIGFAPNPFHGWCTLATCKQEIRKKAEVGDWIVGTGSREKRIGDKLVYAMRVEEILSFDQYWLDDRFRRKRPNLNSSVKMAYGDNIYHRDLTGSWQQENSRHSLEDGTPNPGHVKKDTSVNRVLLSQEYVYHGGSGPIIPSQFRTGYEVDLVHGRPFYRVNFPDKMRDAVIAWIRQDLEAGLQADPYAWNSRD